MIDFIQHEYHPRKFEPFRNAPIYGAALITLFAILMFGLTGCSPKCFRADTNNPCPALPFEVVAR